MEDSRDNCLDGGVDGEAGGILGHHVDHRGAGGDEGCTGHIRPSRPEFGVRKHISKINKENLYLRKADSFTLVARELSASLFTDKFFSFFFSTLSS